MLEQRLRWDFQEEVGHWGQQTFPQATTKSIVAHMRRELLEIEQAATKDELAEECADVYLMLLHLAHREKFDLFLEARKKFGVCLTRKWGKPDAEGVVAHIRCSERVHFYRQVPRLGNVAVSRHAQAGMDEDHISDATFKEVLWEGEETKDGQDIVYREGRGIRIVILMNPTPNVGARLVKTVFKIKPQAAVK